MAGQLGRKTPKQGPALKLARFLKVPDHPDTVDYGLRVSRWDMLGNDQWGDCVSVTWANSRHLTTTALTDRPFYPPLSQVLEFYKTQNPGFPNQDDGMEMQTALETLTKEGGPDGVKAVAFAKVDVDNPDEVKAAVALFGGVWYGVTVTDANMRQFDNHLPWDHVPGSRSLGGHAILGPGYTPNLRLVTWAKETEFTNRFVQYQLDEAWVVIWPEHLGSRSFLDGIDQAELAAAYRDITGRELPTAVTPSDPGAAPFPGADPVVAARIARAAGLRKMTLTEYQNAHWRANFRIRG
jgi:hypothetical protein